MRKLLHLTGFCTLLFGLAAVSCKPEVVPETLDTPSNLASSAVTSTGATLTWAAVEGAESYLVRIADGTPVSATSTTYTASGLTPETSYTWAVQAVKGDLKSDWSSNATFTTAAPPVVPVPVPTGLTSDDVTHESATLSWTAVEGASGYEVKIGDGTPVAVTETSYDAVDLTAETEYTWTVRATATGKEPSDWATNATFTTEAAPVIPLPVPADLVASNITHESATLAWSAVEGASGYEVKIGDGTPVAVTATTYAATGLTAETTYTWTVRATAEGKDPSDWAANANFTTEAAPAVALPVPTGLTSADVTANSATLSWTAAEGATGYEVKINDGTPVAVTATTYAATGLTAATTYTWTVRATAAGKDPSDWAANANFTTEAGEVPLAPPTNIRVDESSLSADGITVLWTPAEGVDGYWLEIEEASVDYDGRGWIIDNPTANRVTARGSFKSGTTYKLRVRSVVDITIDAVENTVGWEKESAIVDGQVFTMPVFDTSFEYADLLGNYSANGTARITITQNGQTVDSPGPREWTGEIFQPENEYGSLITDYYGILNLFGETTQTWMDIVNDELYLDDIYFIGLNEEQGYGVLLTALYMDEDEINASSFSVANGVEHAVKVSWDGNAKTLTFADTYNGRPIAVGEAVFSLSDGSYLGVYSNFFTDVVITLDSNGRSIFSGSPVQVSNLKSADRDNFILNAQKRNLHISSSQKQATHKSFIKK